MTDAERIDQLAETHTIDGYCFDCRCELRVLPDEREPLCPACYAERQENLVAGGQGHGADEMIRDGSIVGVLLLIGVAAVFFLAGWMIGGWAR